MKRRRLYCCRLRHEADWRRPTSRPSLSPDWEGRRSPSRYVITPSYIRLSRYISKHYLLSLTARRRGGRLSTSCRLHRASRFRSTCIALSFPRFHFKAQGGCHRLQRHALTSPSHRRPASLPHSAMQSDTRIADNETAAAAAIAGAPAAAAAGAAVLNPAATAGRFSLFMRLPRSAAQRPAHVLRAWRLHSRVREHSVTLLFMWGTKL